jgi:hypothetical protein
MEQFSKYFMLTFIANHHSVLCFTSNNSTGRQIAVLPHFMVILGGHNLGRMIKIVGGSESYCSDGNKSGKEAVLIENINLSLPRDMALIL